MSLQFIHENGSPYFKEQSSLHIQETPHDQPKVLQLDRGKEVSSRRGMPPSNHSYSLVALGAFFVAITAGTSFLYDQYMSPQYTNGVQNLFTQSSPQENCFDTIDNDGDGLIDCQDPQCIKTYYKDNDGDGYGDNDIYPPPIESEEICESGIIPVGYVLDHTDCNDVTPFINPSKTEICNQIDDNCDGEIDEGFTIYTLYEDNDGDLHGDASKPVDSCTPDPVNGSTFVTNKTDCNDTDEFINPDIIENSCDNDMIDNNCDGNDAPACGLRYSCNNNNCVIDLNGMYSADNCNNMCIAPMSKYRCSNNSCVQDNINGTYFTDTCNNQCIAPINKYKCSNNNCVQDNINGTYFTDTCNNQCIAPINKYKCSNNNCVQDNINGTYFTDTCNNQCIAPINKYKCSNNNCIQDNINGTYFTDTCNNQCIAPINKYKCSNNNCIQDNINGTYFTDTCNNQCIAPINKYKCSNNSCVQDNINGTYTASNCNNQCIAPINKYKCSNNSCVQDNINGTYTASNCNNQCIAPINKYKCSNNSCVQDDVNGTYTGSNCNNQCIAPINKYKCSNNSCVQDDVNGTYTGSNCNNMCSTTPICGNNKLEIPEECDDGNKLNGDGCSSTCILEIIPETCGDSEVEYPEECDDGNNFGNDGCSPSCKREGPYYGGGSNYCGDGLKRSTEACDDGNYINGDGCDSNCYNEVPNLGSPISLPSNRLIVDAIKTMIEKLQDSCAYNDKDYHQILQHYKDIDGDDYRDPAVILTTFCITNGYKRKGNLKFNTDHYASIYETIKIITKIMAISEGVQFNEVHPDLPRVPYRDVSRGRYTDYVNYASEMGLLDGITKTKELKGFTPITTKQIDIILGNIGKDTDSYDIFSRNRNITRDDTAEIMVEIFEEKFVYAEYMMGENIRFYELVLKQLQGRSPSEQEQFIKNLIDRMQSWDSNELEDKLNIYVDGVLKFFDAILDMR